VYVRSWIHSRVQVFGKDPEWYTSYFEVLRTQVVDDCDVREIRTKGRIEI
jgi:hypothetical protein